MKKYLPIFTFLFVSLLLFSIASAYDYYNYVPKPFELPYTTNGHTYDTYVQRREANPNSVGGNYQWGIYCDSTAANFDMRFYPGTVQRAIRLAFSTGGNLSCKIYLFDEVQWSYFADAPSLQLNDYPTTSMNLAEVFRSTSDIHFNAIDGFDFGQYYGLGNVSANQLLITGGPINDACTSWTYSDWSTCGEDGIQTRTILTSSPSGCTGGLAFVSRSCTYTPQLTVSPNPLAGGGIASSGQEIQCGVNGYNYCQADFTLNSEVSLQGYPTSNWAFAYWNDGVNQITENPHTFTMDATKTVVGKFYKTFRNASIEGFSYNINDTGGECVVYVRNETGIDYDAFNGDADGCLALAQGAGYSTGTEPRIGAIAVFSRNIVPDVGHIGIVKVINSPTSIKLRHSNWCSPATCHTVSEDDINLTTTPVMGYIYPIP